jgi:hypothetical protein
MRLHAAAVTSEPLIRTLLAAGADLVLASAEEKTPREIATTRGRSETTVLLH